MLLGGLCCRCVGVGNLLEVLNRLVGGDLINRCGGAARHLHKIGESKIGFGFAGNAVGAGRHGRLLAAFCGHLAKRF